MTSLVANNMRGVDGSKSCNKDKNVARTVSDKVSHQYPIWGKKITLGKFRWAS